MKDTSKFNLLPNKVSAISKNRTVYISSIGTNGYATSAKGYVFDLLSKNEVLQWIQYDIINNTSLTENTAFDNYLSKAKKTLIGSPTNLIVHSIPLVWNELINNSGIITTTCEKIIGRTVWEFEKLHPDWKDAINNSIVTHVSVPTEWNKNIFLKEGITKPILVEPHHFINYNGVRYTLEHLLQKSVIINKGDIKTLNVKNCYKFYCIEQFSDRKNLLNTIQSYCKAFKTTDNVVLFVKTFRANYSIPEQVECAKYINNITNQFPNHAPIIYIREQLTYDEIQSLHYHMDCYFSLTHTEGFGLGIFDAFNHKKPVIVTGYGGHVEYLGTDYPNLVKYVKKPVNAYITQNYYLDNTYEWAEPDESHAVELLKQAYVKGLDSEKYSITLFTQKNNLTPILQQNENAKIINFPYDHNNFYFNSAIFKFKNNRYIATRHCRLNEDKIPTNTIKLYWIDEKTGLNEVPLKINNEVEDEQYEDPRVLVHDNKLYISCANYQQHVSEKIHQKILVLDESFVHIDNIHPIYEGNGSTCVSNTQHQKNWTYFIYENSLMCVYKMDPHTVVEFDYKGKLLTEYKTHCDIKSIWKFGEPRMGSNPILKDGIYHNFFHSSLPWKNPKRQYFMGHYTFESKPPFRIIEISKDPILWGNEADFRYLPNSNPIVVFPCGAIYENDSFFVSFGLNDEKSGIIKI